MKIFIGICVGIVLIAIAATAWVLFSRGASMVQPSGSSSTTTPGNLFPTGGSGQTTVPATPPADAAQVQSDFTGQIQNARQITVDKTVEAGGYALQYWHDDNKGGQALLREDQSGKWVLVSLGGGAWDVPSLVAQGVPQSVAAQLVAAN